MILQIMAIRDSKASLYQHFHTLRSKSEAIRSLQIAVNDPKNMIGQYPSDYELFQIGTIDDESGAVTPMQPKFITAAASLLNEVKNESK